MAFRFRKYSHPHPIPMPINEDVLQSSFENGVEVCSVVSVPNYEYAKGIPVYTDYQLSTLLAAGVPLQPVSTNLLDETPSPEFINNYVNNLKD